MTRTIVDFPDDQLLALDDLCARERISRAEGVRRAVGLLLERSGADAFPEDDECFGAWAKEGIDGQALLKELRAEWDERDSRLRQ